MAVQDRRRFGGQVYEDVAWWQVYPFGTGLVKQEDGA